MAKWSDEKVADLTRKLADTAIDYKQRCEVLEERWEAACQGAREAEAYAEELEQKLAKAVEAGHALNDALREKERGKYLTAAQILAAEKARAILAELK